eukprot:6500230-Ditylum_brightwellii.AAC.1
MEPFAEGRTKMSAQTGADGYDWCGHCQGDGSCGGAGEAISFWIEFVRGDECLHHADVILLLRWGYSWVNWVKFSMYDP